jgi:hypothetical protein
MDDTVLILQTKATESCRPKNTGYLERHSLKIELHPENHTPPIYHRSPRSMIHLPPWNLRRVLPPSFASYSGLVAPRPVPAAAYQLLSS